MSWCCERYVPGPSPFRGCNGEERLDKILWPKTVSKDGSMKVSYTARAPERRVISLLVSNDADSFERCASNSSPDET